jgi:membrane-bound metal-dependent hydrolase YbcI (DUF457 family)
MRGKSHKALNVALAVVTENLFHLTGHPIYYKEISTPSEMIVKMCLIKGVYYACALIVASLPDADLRFSIFGKHRGFTHSLLGWASFALSLLAVGVLTIFLFQTSNIPLSQEYISIGSIAITSSMLGYFYHLLVDSFTVAGIAFLWPMNVVIRLLPQGYRIRTGRMSEYVTVYTVLLVVSLLIWRNLLGF